MFKVCIFELKNTNFDLKTNSQYVEEMLDSRKESNKNTNYFNKASLNQEQIININKISTANLTGGIIKTKTSRDDKSLAATAIANKQRVSRKI